MNTETFEVIAAAHTARAVTEDDLLRRRQQEHLQAVEQYRNPTGQSCMHTACPQCHGTGVKLNGTACIHALACSCPKCRPWC